MGVDSESDRMWPECVELRDMSRRGSGDFKTVKVCR
jgi:hypothetical protein